MKLTLILGIICFLGAKSETENNKWIWEDNGRNEEGRFGGIKYKINISSKEDGRYSEYGSHNTIRPIRPIEYRPPYQGSGLITRPEITVFPSDRPYNPRPPPISEVRPGGLYGSNPGLGGYGRPKPSDYYPNEEEVLTGPIPSWVKEKPFKNYDTCRCTEKFNCPSPGISYGHCDVGKKYCCNNRNKFEDLGSDYPQRPTHSIENGILIGPGGPSGRPGVIHGPENGILVGPGRPGVDFGRPGGYGRPGEFDRPGSFGSRPSGYGSHHGVLVGPSRRPHDIRRGY